MIQVIVYHYIYNRFKVKRNMDTVIATSCIRSKEQAPILTSIMFDITRAIKITCIVASTNVALHPKKRIFILHVKIMHVFDGKSFLMGSPDYQFLACM